MGLCGVDCSRCKFNNYCKGCSMCEASICKKYCSTCDSMCPNRYSNINYCNNILDSIGGPGIVLRSNYELNIPKYIPVIPDKLKTKVEKSIMPFIGVHADKLLSADGRKINDRYLQGYTSALNLHKETKALLHFYIKDKKLDGFWNNRFNLYEKIKKLNFYAVISPNFSVYEDSTRIDHLYNIKRTTIVYNEMIDREINAIPDVSYYSKEDLKRWCIEINKKNIKTISFSFQIVDVRLKASNEWKHYITGFRYLCENINPDVKIIIIGLGSYRRVCEIKNAAPGRSIHILNQSAYIQSRRGILSSIKSSYRDLSFDELFHENLIYFNKKFC